MAHNENNFEQVSELLGTLNRVEPPGDFDARVRARVAQGRPAASRSWPLVLARISVPAALLIALGGYFGWNMLNQPVNVPVVADVQQPDQREREPVSEPIEQPAIEPEDLVATRDSGSRPNSNMPIPDTRLPDRTTPREEPGFSEDISLSPTRIIRPRGIDPDRVITNANIAGNTRRLASEVLGMLGVAASCSVAGCRVSSVSPNSVAANSGLRAGDLIESIDGRPINGGTMFGGQFTAGSLRVRRDGVIVNIALRP